jgi:hypothetical protein
MPVLLDSRVKRGYDNESWAATGFFHTLIRGNDADGREADPGFKSVYLPEYSLSLRCRAGKRLGAYPGRPQDFGSRF